MEYLLREKLERLVQSEIEARVARMHQVRTYTHVYRRERFFRRNAAAVRRTYGAPGLSNNIGLYDNIRKNTDQVAIQPYTWMSRRVGWDAIYHGLTKRVKEKLQKRKHERPGSMTRLSPHPPDHVFSLVSLPCVFTRFRMEVSTRSCVGSWMG